MAEKSFREILENKMGRAEPAERKASVAMPDWTSFIVRPVIKALRPEVGKRYPVQAQTPSPVRAPAPPPEKTVTLKTAEALAAARILGLDASAPLTEKKLKSNYRRLIRDLHPDRYPAELSAEQRRRRSLEFQAVHDAYLVLSEAFRQ